MKRIVSMALAVALLAACTPRSAGTPNHSAPQPEKQAASSERSEPSSRISEIDSSETAGSLPEGAIPSAAKPEEGTEDWMLLLVNAQNGIDADYEPELAEVQNGYRMDVRAVPALQRMIADAAEEGVDLLVCSAYRPYSSQERTFNNSIQTYLAQGYSQADAYAMTAAYIAVPGYSEHQTGLAADIVTPAYQTLDSGFAETAAAKWMAAHAAEYGFILRYPKDKTEITGIAYEPWHFRYVGETAAREITDAGICLEEYLDR